MNWCIFSICWASHVWPSPVGLTTDQKNQFVPGAFLTDRFRILHQYFTALVWCRMISQVNISLGHQNYIAGVGVYWKRFQYRLINIFKCQMATYPLGQEICLYKILSLTHHKRTHNQIIRVSIHKIHKWFFYWFKIRQEIMYLSILFCGLGLYSHTSYDISYASHWSRFPSGPIRRLRYIVTCTSIRTLTCDYLNTQGCENTSVKKHANIWSVGTKLHQMLARVPHFSF